MLRRPRCSIKTDTPIVGTACRDRMLCDVLGLELVALDLYYAGFWLPFLMVSILMANTPLLPGVSLMCLSVGLSPVLMAPLRVPFS